MSLRAHAGHLRGTCGAHAVSISIIVSFTGKEITMAIEILWVSVLLFAAKTELTPG